MPTYFIGLIQLVFWMTLGDLRFQAEHGRRQIGRASASWMVRHGVTNGGPPADLDPSA